VCVKLRGKKQPSHFSLLQRFESLEWTFSPSKQRIKRCEDIFHAYQLPRQQKKEGKDEIFPPVDLICFSMIFVKCSTTIT